jgi:hypothetical protein
MVKIYTNCCANKGYFTWYKGIWNRYTFFLILQPHVDFGLKLLGADAMSIPGLYKFVQVLIFFVFVFLDGWVDWRGRWFPLAIKFQDTFYFHHCHF